MIIIYVAALAGLALLQIALGLLAWRQLTRRLRALADAQQRAASTDVPTSMLVTGLARIEERLQQLEQARQPLPPSASQSGERAYHLAQRMARNGVDAAQIAESCGITLHEANLLWRLHTPNA